MSNGYFIIANVQDDDSFVMVREVWGNYAPDYDRTIQITDGHASLFITPEQMNGLIDQVEMTKADLRREVEPLPGQVDWWTDAISPVPENDLVCMDCRKPVALADLEQLCPDCGSEWAERKEDRRRMFRGDSAPIVDSDYEGAAKQSPGRQERPSSPHMPRVARHVAEYERGQAEGERL
jgi:hypothetical protein